MSFYGVNGVPMKTDHQIMNKECSEDVHRNKRWQHVNLQSEACHSQDTTSWDSFLWVEFIRECVPDSDPNSTVPEILRHKKATVCLWAQSHVGQGWYHIAKWSRRPFPNQRRDLLFAASVQKHHGRTFRDLLGGLWCYGASWTHTGFCPVCLFFKILDKACLIMRSRTLHRQPVSAIGL